MAFENEEDYLESLLKSITEKEESSIDDLSGTESEELQIAETFETSEQENIADTEENAEAELIDEYIQKLLSNNEEAEESIEDELGKFVDEDTVSENIEDDIFEEQPNVENYDEENELINQLDGIIDNINNEIEGNSLDEAVTVEDESVAETEEQIDFSGMILDDEIKNLFGIESVEELADVSEPEDSLTLEELAKIEGIEAENSQEYVAEEQSIAEEDEDENDIGFMELMNKVSDAGIDIEKQQESVEENHKDDVLTDGANVSDFGKNTSVDSKKNIKESAQKKSSKGLMSILFGLFKKNNSESKDSANVNENQKVLDTLFDENGELVESNKKVEKKSLFSRTKKSNKDKAAEKVEVPISEGIDDIEEIEEKPVKKVKKEKEPKPKKEKKKKEAKPKKPKVKKEKLPVDPSELIKINPKVVLLIILLVAGLTGYTFISISSFSYNQSLDEGLRYLNENKYTFAYEAVVGIEPRNEEDAALIEQITVIMSVQKNYNSYERYIKMGMNFEALDALIMAFGEYDEIYDKAIEIGVNDEINEIKELIINTLIENYGITEEMARIYADIEDYEQYVYILGSYGGVRE